MDDLTPFINKVENVLNATMDTLRSHIQKNTSERSKTLDFATFYDHVANWGEKCWLQKKGEDVKDLPAETENDQLNQENPEETKNNENSDSLIKPIDQIKDDSFNLLTEKLSDKSTEVAQMLNKYSDTPESDEIDSKKYFNKII